MLSVFKLLTNWECDEKIKADKNHCLYYESKNNYNNYNLK